MSMILEGLQMIFTPGCLLIMALGVAIGIIFGAIPGLSATMAIALFLPITFEMDAAHGIALLLALYVGGISGGLISAILINIPGTAASIATTWDGHPMALKGEAPKALGVGIVFSFLGTLFGVVLLMAIAQPIADFAVTFSPMEYFAIGLFSMTMVIGLSGDSIVRGCIAGLFGVALGTVGLAPIDSVKRYTFGIYDMQSGFDLLPVLIGLYAVTEIFMLSKRRGEAAADMSGEVDKKSLKIKGFGFSIKEFKSQLGNLVRSSVIGAAVGILPGIGGSAANVLAYSASKSASKHPEKYGTGIIDGIVASETSNNASIGGAMVPLLTLGIPGDTNTAMLLGGLIVQGLAPGPMLFSTNGSFVYAIYIALLLASFVMLIEEFFGLRLFVKLLNIPKHILLPVIFVMCVVGAFATNNRMFDVFSIFIFGAIGYIFNMVKLPLPPVILGFIMGPIVEEKLRSGLMYTNGNFFAFFQRPVTACFMILTILVLVWWGVKYVRKMRSSRKTTA
jgi:putative tricarboxylic transport membrane protein